MNKPTDSEDTIRELLPVYSPRWGHQDHYSVVMSRSRLAVTLNTKTAECVLTPEGEAFWSGHRAGVSNPLLQIMSDDSIYAPAVVPEALEWLLGQWGLRAVEREPAMEALRDLFDWIDRTARGKPTSPFWRQYF
jgi:hypothetical protein